MFCPLCQSEYREGFTRCLECNSPLVQSLDDPSLTDDPIVQLFGGVDEPSFNITLDVLREAGIPFHAAASDRKFLNSSLGSPEFKILIRQSDRERADHAIEEAFGGAPTEDEMALPAEEVPLEQSDDDGGLPPREFPSEWDGKEATVEVWSGDDAAFASELRACFRENGVPSRTIQDDPGRMYLYIRPDDESRVREILREITEGTPPV